ncbi:MAG: hypothetical protein L0221_14095 [Chloroflexi bacterium]|nr:hypothetical protein [Chloroflexota bacterium]
MSVPRWPARRLISSVLAVGLIAGACDLTGDTPIPTFPPASFGSGTTSAAALETRRLVTVALSAEGLTAEAPPVVYRPAESPALAQAPRVVVQADLPDDPQHGYIVIYEFRDAATADGAAREQADYVASGIGFVQFPPDSEFVIRTVGATVIFFSWSPPNSPDPRTPKIAAALETVGTGIPIPR